MSETTDKLICVAAIAGAFGVRGEMKIKPFTAQPEACLSYGPLLDETGAIILTPLKFRAVKKALAVMTEEIKTPEEADALKSTKLYVPRSALPDPDEDDFYHSDLIGLDAKSIDGRRVGKIIAVQDFGAGDMLEIKSKGGKSFFHPFTKTAVPKVDVKAGRVIIEIVEADEAE